MDSRKKGVPLSQWVYDELKKKIITCEFRPGTIIEEVALSRHLEVSRTPIRSALSHLESENLVYSTPRKGFTVKQLSIKEFNEIGVVREMLEGFAAETAAVNLLKGEMEELTEFMTQFKAFQGATLDEEVLARHNDLDMQLHSLILRVCANRTIERIIHNLRDKIQQIRFIATRERFEKSIREHIEIIKALKNRDPKMSKKTMTEHISALRRDYYKQ